MADVAIAIRGISPASNTPPGGAGTGRDVTTTVSVDSDPGTAAGDYLLVIASVDFVSSLTLDNASGVETWQQLTNANDGNTMRTGAWLGRVTTGGPRTVTARQNDNSGLHVQVWTLDAGGADITRDGALRELSDRFTPYTFSAITAAGDQSLLVCYFGIVQFSGVLDFGAAPAGMTIGCEHYYNQYSGQQSVYEQLDSPGSTGSRALTSNIGSISGGAGAMFALRAQSSTTEVAPPAGVVAVTGPAATVTDPTVVVAPAAGPVDVTGPAPTVREIPLPGGVTVTGPAPQVAHVYYPPAGPVDVWGPPGFAGSALAEPGTVTVTGPAVQVAYGGQDGPSQLGGLVLPEAQPTRVLAQNILTGEWLHWDLRVDNLEVTETLSGAQLISGEFPTEISDLRDLDLTPWATWIHVEEGGQIRASGILQPAQIDENETLTLDAVGVSGYLHGIPYLGEFTLSGTDPASGESGIGVGLDPADIVRDIWAHVQSFSDGDLGVTVTGSTGVKIGTPARDVEFEDDQGEQVAFVAGPYSKLQWWQAQDCGAELDSLASETPFDWRERQAWNTDRTAVDHWIEIGYPRLGAFRPLLRFAQEENIVAAVGPEEPDDRYASVVVALGKGEGSSRVRGYAGRPLGTRLRRVAIVDDKTIESTSAADSAAYTELDARQALADITEIVVDARHDNAALGSYSVGDEGTVVADVPWIGLLHVRQRILTIAYSPGSETVKLGLRAASSFTFGGPASA